MMFALTWSGAQETETLQTYRAHRTKDTDVFTNENNLLCFPDLRTIGTQGS